MRKLCFAVLAIFFIYGSVYAQSKQNDIPVSQLPQAVFKVLNQYFEILGSDSLENCAKSFVSIAGGSLLGNSVDKLRTDVSQFSLKKDFNNSRFYAYPLKLTRVNKRFSNGDGYGETRIKGWVYKIWIDKKDGVNGMPAPISIIVPEDHPFFKLPRVIGIGSL
jgi:hypothetical protein